MPLPEADRFSLEDVAERWGKSKDYVEDLVRTFQFPHLIEVRDSQGRRLETRFYFDPGRCPDLAAYGRRRRVEGSVCEEFLDPAKLPNGFVYGTSCKVFIPREELEAFETKHNVQPPRSEVQVKSELHILADELHQYFYGDPKPAQRITKKMVKEEARRRKPDLVRSEEAVNVVAGIVLKDHRPGRPTSV